MFNFVSLFISFFSSMIFVFDSAIRFAKPPIIETVCLSDFRALKPKTKNCKPKQNQFSLADESIANPLNPAA